MSGILGVWNLDGQPVDGGLLSRMGAIMRHRGPDGEGRWLDGPVGMACLHTWVTPEDVNERQPLGAESGSRLVLDGRLDNRDELLALLDVPRGASDASIALAAHQRWGDAFVERLNGDFALAVWSPLAQRLLLARDAIGVRPIYYFRNERLFAFASEIKPLLAHPDVPVRPDDDGLADFMLIGSRPIDRQDVTCFDGIKAVVPAHVVTVSPGRVTTRRYWDFDVGQALRLGSFNEYAEAFKERFEVSVRRRLRAVHPVGVSVSGGLDSSSIFCQAETFRRAGSVAAPGLVGVSYLGAQGTDADERRFLPDMERAYGVSVERIPMEPLLGLVRGADEQVTAIEAPFLDYAWGVSRAVREAARAGGARILLSGHWGDQMLFSTRYLVDLVLGLRWGTAYRHAREWEQWLGVAEARVHQRRIVLDLLREVVPQALVPPLKWLRRRIQPRQRPKPWFSASFLKAGMRFADQPATPGRGFHSAQAKSLYVEARSKYHVHCMEWNNKAGALLGLDVAFPFLDRDLVSFMISIPGEMQNHGGVPRALLREAMRGILPEPVRTRTWKADFSAAVTDGIVQDMADIGRTLSGDSAGVRHGYFAGPGLAREVDRLTRRMDRSNCLDSWDLADMFGLELWLRVFLGSGAAPANAPFLREEALHDAASK